MKTNHRPRKLTTLLTTASATIAIGAIAIVGCAAPQDDTSSGSESAVKAECTFAYATTGNQRVTRVDVTKDGTTSSHAITGIKNGQADEQLFLHRQNAAPTNVKGRTSVTQTSGLESKPAHAMARTLYLSCLVEERFLTMDAADTIAEADKPTVLEALSGDNGPRFDWDHDWKTPVGAELKKKCSAQLLLTDYSNYGVPASADLGAALTYDEFKTTFATDSALPAGPCAPAASNAPSKSDIKSIK
jgi:hypothetical protein